MQEEGKRFRVYEGVGMPPVSSPGPRRKWGDLPLETIETGDLIEMPLNREGVEHLIASIRSYVYRVSRRTNKKFSVRKTAIGIGIWRVE